MNTTLITYILLAFIVAFYAVGVMCALQGYPKLKRVCFRLGFVANVIAVYVIFTANY